MDDSPFKLIREKLVSYYGENIWVDQVASEILGIVRKDAACVAELSKGMPFDPSDE